MNYPEIITEKSKYNTNVCIVKVSGRLDAQPADKLENELTRLINNGEKKLILDLRNVNYLGSSGIRVFLGISNKLKKIGGAMKIIKMPPTGLKIIRAMEIEDRFEIFESEEEAVKTF